MAPGDDIRPLAPTPTPPSGRAGGGGGGESASVRVALRIRPLSADEVRAGHRVCIFKDPGAPLAHFSPAPPRTTVFSFDDVYDTSSSQAEIFSTSVLPLIDAFFEGYNATVFAYGQVRRGGRRSRHWPPACALNAGCGAQRMGRTWDGPDGLGQDLHHGLEPQSGRKQRADGRGRNARYGAFCGRRSAARASAGTNVSRTGAGRGRKVCVCVWGGGALPAGPRRASPGVIPRAGRQIFQRMELLKAQAATAGLAPPTFALTCTFLELYNEKFYDLLSSQRKALRLIEQGGQPELQNAIVEEVR